MSEAILNAQSRKIGVHSIVTNIRDGGGIPAVLYRTGSETLPISIKRDEYERVTKGHNRNFVIKLVVDGNESSSQRVIVRDIQRDVVKGTIKHLDFMGLDEAKAVTLKVPVRFVGEAYGVKTEGGILQHVLRRVDVQCLPSLIPEHLDLDVTAYKNGQAIYVRELKPVDGIKVLTDGKQVLGTIMGAKEVEVATAPAAAAATPAAGAAAEGAKPAAGTGAAAGAGAKAPAADAKAKKPEKK